MILSIVAGIAIAALIIGILSYHWVNVPLLTKVQDDGPMEGVVDSIVTLPGGLVQIGLKQGGTIDPSLQVGRLTMLSASITRYAHFRPGQTLPEKGMMVKAEVTSRLYPLRNRSLSWVRSWVLVDSIEPGLTVSVA
ncbi:MAG: hypothetical protein V4682_01940 [Patescibacteria group bacterium]